MIKFSATPGHVVIELKKPADFETARGVNIEGRALTPTARSVPPYGEIVSICYGPDQEYKIEDKLEAGDLIVFQPGIVNPVTLRDPDFYGKRDAPIFALMAIECIVSRIDETNIQFTNP